MGRVLWSLVGTILVLPMLGWGAYSGVDVLSHEEHTVVRTYGPDAVDAVDISNDVGSVVVVAAPVDRVRVQIRISEGLRRTGSSVRLDGRTLRLHGTCPNVGGTWCRVRFEVQVPLDTAVTVRGDAQVEVRGTGGPVDVHTTDASVRVDAARGPLRVRSSAGSVTVTRSRSSSVSARSGLGSVSVQFEVAPRSVVAISNRGSAEVVVPRTGDAYAVEVGSTYGSSHSEVRSDPSADRRLSVRSRHGRATVRYG